MFIQNDSVSKAFSSVLSRGQVRDAFLCHLLLVVAGWRVVGVDDVIVGGAVGGVLLSRFDGVRAGNLQQHLGLSDKGKHLYTTQSHDFHTTLQCFERSLLILPFTLPLCQSGFSHVIVLRTPHSPHLEPVLSLDEKSQRISK